jgi:exodeoxyribonuclease VII large subunit
VVERSVARLNAVRPTEALRTGTGRCELRLEAAGRRLADVHPARRLALARSTLDRVAWREPIGHRMERAGDRLSAGRRQLDALDPARVLDRGFAIVRTGRGAVVRRADEVNVGDDLDVQVAVGRLAVRVAAVNEGERS